MIRKILISTVIGFVTFAFVILAVLVGNIEVPDYLRTPLSWSWLPLVVFIISMNKVKRGQSAVDMASDALDAVKSIQNNVDLKSANFYAVAEEEYDSGIIDKGLWSQALVKAKGDETLRKVEYMKLRVMQLKRES